MLNSTQKKNRRRKNGVKDWIVLYKLMINDVYRKTMENLRNKINVKLSINKKSFFTCTSKSCDMLQKIFDNDLVAIRKKQIYINV